MRRVRYRNLQSNCPPLLENGEVENGFSETKPTGAEKAEYVSGTARPASSIITDREWLETEVRSEEVCWENFYGKNLKTRQSSLMGDKHK